MPTPQCSSGMLTFFVPLLALNPDLVGNDELINQIDSNWTTLAYTVMVKLLRKCAGPDGWWGIVTEICPTTKRVHIHCAFQCGKTTAGNVRKVSMAMLRTALSTPLGGAVAGVVIDLKTPLRTLDGPKSIVNYLKKGDVITKAEWQAAGAEHPQHGVGGANNFMQEGSIRLPEPGSQGSRTDIDELRDVICGDHDELDAPDNYRHLIADKQYAKYVTVCAKYQSFVKDLIANRYTKERQIIADYRPWQQEVMDMISEPCTDTRSIHWYYDPRGAAGKSTLVKDLLFNHRAITLSGKQGDIFHAYMGQRIAIFDIPRSCAAEYINYGAIEKIKDGAYFSPKYNSHSYVRDYEAHVLVFANQMPNEINFTGDRLVIHTLSEPDDTFMYTGN